MNPPPTALATPEDIARLDIRAGTVTAAQAFPEARRPAIKLWVDLGPELGTAKSSAQLTERYTPDQLMGRRVLVVVNLPPRQIGPFMSEVLVLGLADEAGAIALAQFDAGVPNGARLR